MKIKSIAAICKKNKNIAIFERYSNDGDILTQYIGDGSAVYPVVGLPQLDKESLLTIFDVPEKDRDNYFVKTLGVPAGISFEDTDETERHVEREGISIIYSGRTLKPIRTTRGLVFIESRYLSPVADVLDVLELYERRTAAGAPYIVAKAGFLLQAVIMPYDVIRIEFRAIGAVTNPVLLNVDTREFIKLNISLVAGDVLTVSTGYGEKAVKLNRGGTITDAFRYLDVDSSYLQIAVGDNLFRYSADANAENLEVSIYHNNLYLWV